MMALFLHFFYTTYVGAKRSRRLAADTPQTVSSNGHVIDKSREPYITYNNNSLTDSTRDRKEQ